MKGAFLVFLGGGLGSVLRYGIYKLMHPLGLAPVYGTLAVNILGSLLLGILMGYAIREGQLSGNLMLFLSIGLCGGFTTFSTFAFENQVFLRSGDYLNFSLYAFGSLAAGILAIITGLYLTKFI